MNKKLLILIILSIFILGMVIGVASASHTYKVGKYKITVTDKQYQKLKKAQNGSSYWITKKTGKYHKYKAPKYKTVKVKKKKWKYKKVLVDQTVYSKDWSDATYHDYDYRHYKYVKHGWKYYGYKITKSSNGHKINTYDKFKKKVLVTVKKKVRVNGYKIKKAPIKIRIGANEMDGGFVYVFAEWYNNGYNTKDFGGKSLNF